MNVNSLLPKIDGIRYAAARANAVGIWISESKLEETILQSGIQISNYKFLRCNRNRNGGGVTCYIRSDIGYLQKHFFPKEIENNFAEILLNKAKPLKGHVPPNQSNFLEIINANSDNSKSNISTNFNTKTKSLRGKYLNTEFFLVRIFLSSDWIWRFTP